MTCKYRFFGDWAKEYDPNEHSVSETTETRQGQREGNVPVAEPTEYRGYRSPTQQETEAFLLQRDALALGMYRYSSGRIERVESNQQSESDSPSQRQAYIQESIERLAAEYRSIHNYQSRRYESNISSNTTSSETCTGQEFVENQQPDALARTTRPTF